MSKIRLRTTGVVVFGSRIASVVTGLAFLVMITRWLNPAQFGLWEFIIDLVTFASYPMGVVAFWVTRDVARGRAIGRTGIVLSLVMSIAGIGIYILLALLTFSAVATGLLPFLLAMLLVPSSYWNQASNSIVAGFRPSAVGYSIIASEVVKLAVAYPLLYVYKIGIDGVILALMTSYLMQAAIATYLTRDASRERLDLAFARRWFGLAWIPGLNTLPYIVGIADTFVASLGFGTTITGYYQAAFAVASITGYSLYLSSALYPLLLRGGGEHLTTETLEFSMLFGIPMSVGAAVLAPSILYLLSPRYVASGTGLVILSFSLLLTTISGILDQALMGRETVDVENERNLSRYIRSDLFFVPGVNLAYSVVYVLVMFLALRFASLNGYSTSGTVTLWAAAQLSATAGVVLVKGSRRGVLARLLPIRSLARYAASALLMGVVVYILSNRVIAYGGDAVELGLRLLILVAVGAVAYFGTLFAIDGKFRRLVRSLAGS